MREDEAIRLCAMFGVSPEEVLGELQRRSIQRQRFAATQARAIAGTRGKVWRSGGHVATLDFRVPADSFHYWGGRLGYECWNDTEFRTEFKQDNPETVTTTDWDKTTITKPNLPC